MADPLEDLDNLEDAFPLTGVQAGMLFESLARPKDGIYNGLVTASLPHDLEVGRFRHAWSVVVQRHQCLRSLILWEGLDQPVQVVQSEGQPDWRQEDWSADDCADRLEALHNELRHEARDFSASTPLCICLVKFPEGETRFALTCHHAFLDNWSVDVVLDEVAQIYRGDTPLAEPVRYRDFIDWLGGQDEAASRRHWQTALKGVTEPTRLAFPKPRVSNDPGVREVTHQLDRSASDALRQVATELRVTLGTVLAAIWGIVVHRISDTDDVIFGLAVTQRPPKIVGIERAVGNFVATLPVRLHVTSNATLRDMISGLHTTRALDASHATIALSHLASIAGMPSGTSLFDTILSIEQPIARDTPEPQPLFNDVKVRDRSEFHLSVFASTGDQIKLRAQFDIAGLSPEDARTALEAFATALRSASEHLDAPAQGLPILDNVQLDAALRGDVGPELTASRGTTARQIERRFADRPEATAIVSGDFVLSYGELAQRVGAFQAALIDTGAVPGSFIAICLNEPADMIAAMLAVWRVGCTYAPIGTEEPQARIAAKLAALNCDLVITCAATQAHLPREVSQIVLPEGALVHGNPAEALGPDDPAYVIFTSGSTGVPKGVVVTHANLAASTAARAEWYGETPTRFLLLSPLIFDSSVAGLFWTLAGGGTLVVPDADTLRNPKALAGLIAEQRITHTLCLPSIYELFLDAGTPQQLQSLETVIVAGEPVSPRLVGAHHTHLPATLLVNEYGPTEATVWCAAARLQQGEQAAPIGRAIHGSKLVLRDRHGRPVPPGLPAELYVGGHGVAAGYLGMVEETAARFLSDRDMPGGRLYRTGDLVRQRADGQLDYIGRIDDQLKIRGHRVEPTEIESAIMALPDVAATAVVPHASSAGTELIAYIVPVANAILDPDDVRTRLGSVLPDYMLPQRILALEALPHTPTGKVDRRALSKRSLPSRASQELASPATPTEARLVELWCDVLNREARDFGTTDAFFSVGGESLSAMRLVGRVAEAFDIDLSVAEVLGSGLTVQKMATLVDARKAAPHGPTPAHAPVSFPVQVSEGLKNLWLAARFHPGAPFFNLDTAVRLTFVPSHAALRAASAALAEKHGALRLKYQLDDGTLSLVPNATPPDILVTFQNSASQVEVEAWIADLVLRPFDVMDGPLWRCGLLECGPNDAILVLVIHHTIADGWSLDLLMDDLVAVLADEPMPPRPDTWDTQAFPRHVAQHKDRADPAQLEFWSETLAGFEAPARIATDHPMPRVARPEGHEVRRVLSSSTERALRDVAEAAGTTLLPIVWASWAVLTWWRSGSRDTLVAVSQAGRDTPHLMGAVGCFTQPLPYRLQIHREANFEELFGTARNFSDLARRNMSVAAEDVIDFLPKTRQTYLTAFAQSALQINDFGASRSTSTDWARPFAHPAITTSLFELSVEWRRGESGLECGILARADLFEAASVEQLLEEYLDLIQAFLASPGQSLEDFP